MSVNPDTEPPTFAEALASFLSACVPEDAPLTQHKGMRLSFISGAWAMHMLHVYGMPENDEKAQEYLRKLHNEIEKYMVGGVSELEQKTGSPKSH